MLPNAAIVLWLGHVCFTLFPAWFLYSFYRQSRRTGYRERSALPFAAALFTWTAVGVINAISVYEGYIPYYSSGAASPASDVLAVVRVLLSTINTLLLAIGSTRLDNYPTRFRGEFVRGLSNTSWMVLGLVLLSSEVLVARFGRGVEASQTLDIGFGLVAVVPITVGLLATFLRYEMGKVLTAGIIGALWSLEVVLFIARNLEGKSTDQALFLTSVVVTSKAVFTVVLVLVAAAWGRYYTSGTVGELIKGELPQRVRPLFEVIPGGSTEHDRRHAYDVILSFWPDSPALLEGLKTEGPSSKEVLAAAQNPEMIAGLVEARVLNLSLSHVGNDVTTGLMKASTRVAEDSGGEAVGQESSQKR